VAKYRLPWTGQRTTSCFSSPSRCPLPGGARGLGEVILRSNLITCWVMFAVAGFTSTSLAVDHVLTIGGGYSPRGNQVSLEKNVLYFQRLLGERAPGGVAHDIYFADGNNPNRDLQYRVDEDDIPPANRMMAELLAKDDYLDLAYRDHEIPGLQGPSRRAALNQWFQETGSKLKAGDRLLIYATAHGGKSKNKKNDHDTKLYLWDGDSIRVPEFVELLDKLPKGVEVALVMVQCYSGGYSHVIFNEGDPSKGLSDRVRSGFFATVHNRPAAGCTPDIDEENYQEYSSYFWAGLTGKTRTGKEVELPDYDGDGRVTFEEAHAFSLLTSDSIDVSIKTSDAFLREFSEKGGDLLSEDADLAALLEHATPVQQAVLNGLAEQLDLGGGPVIEAAEKEAKNQEQLRKRLADERNKKGKRYNELKDEIADSLKRRWPELANTLSPQATQLLTSQSGEFLTAIQSNSAYSEMTQLRREREELSGRRLDAERRWAKCQRLIRVAENVILAANLEEVADEETVEAYQRLLAAERATLAD